MGPKGDRFRARSSKEGVRYPKRSLQLDMPPGSVLEENVKGAYPGKVGGKERRRIRGRNRG